MENNKDENKDNKYKPSIGAYYLKRMKEHNKNIQKNIRHEELNQILLQLKQFIERATSNGL